METFSWKESLAYQIASPFNKKIGCFVQPFFNLILWKNKLIVEWGKLGILQASDLI